MIIHGGRSLLARLVANKVFVLSLNLSDPDYSEGYMAARIAETESPVLSMRLYGLGNQPGSFATLRFAESDQLYVYRVMQMYK